MAAKLLDFFVYLSRYIHMDNLVLFRVIESCDFLLLQDTAGQERFHALGPIYYRDSNGAILVYDITDEDSFMKVFIL